jgi:TIR domain
MGPPWYFLSYAHRDVRDTWVERFNELLAERVARLLGLPSDAARAEIGFFDKANIMLGDSWPTALQDALGKTRAMVCLCSPSYFNSVSCGREVQAFHERIRSAFPHIETPKTSNEYALIIPVLSAQESSHGQK